MNDLAVIVLTFNEETNLPACLDSVAGWAREIFVVDSYSTDRTVDIALAYADRGVQVVQHSFEDYSKQWNWAISALPIAAAWTLKLDADERVTQPFKEETARLFVKGDSRLNGVYFRRRFYFMNTQLRWIGNVGYDLRMWRTGRAIFENRSVNEHALVEGAICYFDSYVDHADQKPLTDWLDKHNRYSSLEALNVIQGNDSGNIQPRLWGTPDQRRVWLRKCYRYLPLRPMMYFVYLYFIRGGVLDGAGGFRYSFLRAQYMYWIELKIVEYKSTGALPALEWPRRGTAHPAVLNSSLQRLVDGR